jgi:hypothetical protein
MINDSFPESARDLLDVSGQNFIERLGLEPLRQIVFDVLCGTNVRGATEQLTRRRLSLLSAALLATAVKVRAAGSELLPAARADLDPLPNARTRKVPFWFAGLTEKQQQNVLRSEAVARDEYMNVFEETVKEAAAEAGAAYGELSLQVELDGTAAAFDWEELLYLCAAIGSQTLAIRGSEKSLYGKLFEKLVLGGVLSTLGFELCAIDEVQEGVQSYWLSSRGAKRESDATAILASDTIVRFDIGFIGVGNTEISLDKVTRYERDIEIAGQRRYVKTIIIVDRIGSRSTIVELAGAVDGAIIQMSHELWPRTFGRELEALGSFSSPLEGLNDDELRDTLWRGVEAAPFEEILQLAAAN